MYACMYGFKLHLDPSATLNNVAPLNIFYWMQISTNSPLDYILLIPSMFENFQDNQRSITISSIYCLNFKILHYKIMHKK